MILACGGKAAPKTGSDGNGYLLAKSMGHSVIPTVPALVQLVCTDKNLKAVSGVRLDAKLTLFCGGKKTAEERGELQLTDYGISGIVTFQLSRLAAYSLLAKKETKVVIDCLPDFSKEEYQTFAEKRLCGADKKSTLEEFFTGMLNKKLMLYFISLAGLKTGETLATADRKKLDKVFSLCREFSLTVSDTKSFDNAQVTAGGFHFLRFRKIWNPCL